LFSEIYHFENTLDYKVYLDLFYSFFLSTVVLFSKKTAAKRIVNLFLSAAKKVEQNKAKIHFS
jgi:hypothetical protein